MQAGAEAAGSIGNERAGSRRRPKFKVRLWCNVIRSHLKHPCCNSIHSVWLVSQRSKALQHARVPGTARWAGRGPGLGWAGRGGGREVTAAQPKRAAHGLKRLVSRRLVRFFNIISASGAARSPFSYSSVEDFNWRRRVPPACWCSGPFIPRLHNEVRFMSKLRRHQLYARSHGAEGGGKRRDGAARSAAAATRAGRHSRAPFSRRA